MLNDFSVPIFDSRNHFRTSHIGDDWRAGFNVENILTQAENPDDRFTGEIPVDSLVAVHCLLSMRGSGNVSFSLLGAQVLVTPIEKGVTYFSDLP